MKAEPLRDYIDRAYNRSQKRFAEANKIKPPQVTQWMDKGFIVVDGELFSPRRKLNN